MRLSLSAALMSAALVVIGAGCSSSTSVEVESGMPVPGTQTPEMEVNGSMDAAAGTQMEGTTPENDTPDAMIDVGAGAGADVMVGATKEFTVIASNFSFDIKEMRVKKGDTVRVTFRNAEGFHDWRLDEFSAATAQLQAGGEETVTFVADKTGTFEYYCSVGKHRAMGMKGSLIVE